MSAYRKFNSSRFVSLFLCGILLCATAFVGVTTACQYCDCTEEYDWRRCGNAYQDMDMCKMSAWNMGQTAYTQQQSNIALADKISLCLGIPHGSGIDPFYTNAMNSANTNKSYGDAAYTAGANDYSDGVNYVTDGQNAHDAGCHADAIDYYDLAAAKFDDAFDNFEEADYYYYQASLNLSNAAFWTDGYQEPCDCWD